MSDPLTFRLKDGTTLSIGTLHSKWNFWPLASGRFEYPLAIQYIGVVDGRTQVRYKYVHPDFGPFWPTIHQEAFFKAIWKYRRANNA
jgi:hypothetical protein